MLPVVVSALAFGFDASGFMAGASVRAPAASMILGLGKKTATPVVEAGLVVPTRTAALKTTEMADATAAFADAAAAFALAAQSLGVSNTPQLPFATPTKTADSPITLDEVTALQTGWANAIKTISATHAEGG